MISPCLLRSSMWHVDKRITLNPCCPHVTEYSDQSTLKKYERKKYITKTIEIWGEKINQDWPSLYPLCLCLCMCANATNWTLLSRRINTLVHTHASTLQKEKYYDRDDLASYALMSVADLSPWIPLSGLWIPSKTFPLPTGVATVSSASSYASSEWPFTWVIVTDSL